MNFVTPFDLFSALLESYLSQLKLSRRHQSLKMPISTLKMRFFYVYASCLKETRVLYATCLYNTRVYLENATIFIATHVSYTSICIATRVYLLHTRLMSLQPVYSCEKYVFLSLGSLVSYATDSFSCNQFVFDPISSEAYK